jgi:hypothetical protein
VYRACWFKPPLSNSSMAHIGNIKVDPPPLPAEHCSQRTNGPFQIAWLKVSRIFRPPECTLVVSLVSVEQIRLKLLVMYQERVRPRPSPQSVHILNKFSTFILSYDWSLLPGDKRSAFQYPMVLPRPIRLVSGLIDFKPNSPAKRLSHTFSESRFVLKQLSVGSQARKLFRLKSIVQNLACLQLSDPLRSRNSIALRPISSRYASNPRQTALSSSV